MQLCPVYSRSHGITGTFGGGCAQEDFTLGLRLPHKEVTTSSQGAKKTPFLETTNVKLESKGQLSLSQGRQSSRTGHAGSDQDWDFHADTMHMGSGLVCDQPLGGSSFPRG